MLALVGLFGLLLWAALASVQGRPIQPNTPATAFLGFGFMASVVLSLIGVVIGLAALAQSDRSKMCPLIGLLANIFFLFGAGSLLIFGMLTSK